MYIYIYIVIFRCPTAKANLNHRGKTILNADIVAAPVDYPQEQTADSCFGQVLTGAPRFAYPCAPYAPVRASPAPPTFPPARCFTANFSVQEQSDTTTAPILSGTPSIDSNWTTTGTLRLTVPPVTSPLADGANFLAVLRGHIEPPLSPADSDLGANHSFRVRVLRSRSSPWLTLPTAIVLPSSTGTTKPAEVRLALAAESDSAAPATIWSWQCGLFRPATLDLIQLLFHSPGSTSYGTGPPPATGPVADPGQLTYRCMAAEDGYGSRMSGLFDSPPVLWYRFFTAPDSESVLTPHDEAVITFTPAASIAELVASNPAAGEFTVCLNLHNPLEISTAIDWDVPPLNASRTICRVVILSPVAAATDAPFLPIATASHDYSTVLPLMMNTSSVLHTLRFPLSHGTSDGGSAVTDLAEYPWQCIIFPPFSAPDPNTTDAGRTNVSACLEAPAKQDSEASTFDIGPRIHAETLRGNGARPAAADVLFSGEALNDGAFVSPFCARFHDGGPGPARAWPDPAGYATVAALSCSRVVGGYFDRPQRFVVLEQALYMVQRTGGGAAGGASSEWLNFTDLLRRTGGTAAANGTGSAVTFAVESAQSFGVLWQLTSHPPLVSECRLLTSRL